ncbi:hypothetical protein DVDV_1150 [Desulfovibrio sp. DV]|nr:hypothetical protein DVDV_1150 [Desulfovibrio sp. DV]
MVRLEGRAQFDGSNDTSKNAAPGPLASWGLEFGSMGQPPKPGCPIDPNSNPHLLTPTLPPTP